MRWRVWVQVWRASAHLAGVRRMGCGGGVERRTARETGCVSDRVRTRQPLQRTQPKIDAGVTRQGLPHCGPPNRYDAERAQSPSLGGGEQQAQRARFSAGLHVPRAAAQ